MRKWSVGAERQFRPSRPYFFHLSANMMRKHDSDLTPLAAALRKNMTKEEKHLWYDFLRGYDVKFYRQRVIGNYIADFYCPQAKLVIELDGSQHYLDNGIRNDNKRSDFLNSLGISVMRFSNLEISKQFHGVCEMIHNYVSVTVKKDSP